MKMIRQNEHGFTLLELVVSMAIIVMIIALAGWGLRLGITSRDVGTKKAETYQRLRFIGEQLAIKIKSFHPFFYDKSLLKTETEDTPEKPQNNKKILAFEGKEHSIRFISFADTLSQISRRPYMHEVRFYLGEYPGTEEQGIIMMEREFRYDNVFEEPSPDEPGTHFLLLAKDVAFLDFRYYKVNPLSAEDKELQEETGVNYAGEWVAEIFLQTDEFLESLEEDTGKTGATDKSKISMPRAVEISVGIHEPPAEGGEDEERRLVQLPPIIVPLHSGVEFIREVQEEDDTAEENVAS